MFLESGVYRLKVVILMAKRNPEQEWSMFFHEIYIYGSLLLPASFFARQVVVVFQVQYMLVRSLGNKKKFTT